mmetsp:Transcript_18289/g.46832  ORF Transcript_18289/g.46832 Transcript_18289/m.46832 type:complete len:219 (+) Transcript_18289:357-1013(+)
MDFQVMYRTGQQSTAALLTSRVSLSSSFDVDLPSVSRSSTPRAPFGSSTPRLARQLARSASPTMPSPSPSSLRKASAHSRRMRAGRASRLASANIEKETTPTRLAPRVGLTTLGSLFFFFPPCFCLKPLSASVLASSACSTCVTLRPLTISCVSSRGKFAASTLDPCCEPSVARPELAQSESRCLRSSLRERFVLRLRARRTSAALRYPFASESRVSN